MNNKLFMFFAAKFDNSNVLGELLFSASNLLVLLNDTLLRSATHIKLNVVGIVVFKLFCSNIQRSQRSPV